MCLVEKRGRKNKGKTMSPMEDQHLLHSTLIKKKKCVCVSLSLYIYICVCVYVYFYPLNFHLLNQTHPKSQSGLSACISVQYFTLSKGVNEPN